MAFDQIQLARTKLETLANDLSCRYQSRAVVRQAQPKQCNVGLAGTCQALSR